MKWTARGAKGTAAPWVARCLVSTAGVITSGHSRVKASGGAGQARCLVSTAGVLTSGWDALARPVEVDAVGGDVLADEHRVLAWLGVGVGVGVGVGFRVGVGVGLELGLGLGLGLGLAPAAAPSLSRRAPPTP